MISKKVKVLEIEYSKEDGEIIIISASISDEDEEDVVIKSVSFFDFWDSFWGGQIRTKIVKIVDDTIIAELENEYELKKYLINN